jgi:hypothetical protein
VSPGSRASQHKREGRHPAKPPLQPNNNRHSTRSYSLTARSRR